MHLNNYNYIIPDNIIRLVPLSLGSHFRTRFAYNQGLFQLIPINSNYFGAWPIVFNNFQSLSITSLSDYFQ